MCTHASNVTGDGNDIAQIGTLCEKYNLYFILDASQTAGTIEIDMEQNHISAICFTGHKGLFGPQGTGGIALADGVCVKPLLSVEAAYIHLRGNIPWSCRLRWRQER